MLVAEPGAFAMRVAEADVKVPWTAAAGLDEGSGFLGDLGFVLRAPLVDYIPLEAAVT
jgi:hypothetical protein